MGTDVETPVAEAETVRRTTKPQHRLTGQEKAAAIAAVASGTPKTLVAQQLGVHVNTIHNLLASVRKFDHPVNPLNEKWVDRARIHAETAITLGLTTFTDPYKAAALGVKVKEGIGDFTGAQVEVNAQINVSWGAPLKLDEAGECIDVKACNVEEGSQVTDSTSNDT